MNWVEAKVLFQGKFWSITVFAPFFVFFVFMDWNQPDGRAFENNP